jgi:hypothetical protein
MWLAEHSFPDRLRLRTVQIAGLFVCVAGAELGGLETGLRPVWRWLSFEVLKPPFKDQLNEVRAEFGYEHGRDGFRRLVAAFGIPWREVSLDTAVWQIRKVERAPVWLCDRLLSREDGYSAEQLDRLRRLIVSEDVTEMQSALGALEMYRARALDRPAVVAR